MRLATVIFGTPGGPAGVLAAVAETDIERARGLSARTSPLPSNLGMLFAWDSPQVVALMMRETRVPLDAVFIGADGTVVEVAEMQPLQQEIVTSSEPVQLALEVAGGWCRARGVVAGCAVEISPVD